jgi:hypothetical protein
VQNTTYFNTLHDPSDPTDLFFTVIGDWGQGTTGEAQIAALNDAANTPMIITVGDNTYPNGTQSELDNNAMAYYQSPLQRAFYFPTLGNHDLKQRRQRQLGELGAHQDVRPADQLAGAGALLLVGGRRRALHQPRQRQLLQRHPDQLARQPAGDEPAQVEVRLLPPHRVLVRQRRRLARQRRQYPQHLGTHLGAQPGGRRLPWPRSHL